MQRVFKAPQKIDWNAHNTSIFLGGSIDMGTAENWQEKVTEELKDYPVDIYNPRRDDWDSTWVQSIENPKFKEQVEWELHAQSNCADVICYYFDPNGQAPITLLELGLFKDQDIVVCCPDGYFRQGNVEVTCKYFKIPIVKSLDEMIIWLKGKIQ